MALTIKENIVIAVKEESSEGTYLTPSGATSFFAVLEDGAEMVPNKDLLERGIITGSIGNATPRTGMKTVSGTIGVEFKAGSSAGAAPEYASFLTAALGAVRTNAATTTKSSGNTAATLQIEDADIADLLVGDIIVVKQSGAYHVSPIISRVTTPGSASVTMLVAHPSGDCTDSVVIAAYKTYYTANSGHPSLSISKYVESLVLETGAGCRVSSMALEGFSTGQLASLKFGFEGMSFTRSLTAPSYTPSFDTSMPPVILNAKVYVDGTAVEINELSLSVENTLAFATSTASSNGRISGRVADRSVTGSFNPYKQGDSIANYTKFLNTTQYSLFAYAANPTSTAGEFDQVVAVYMPTCVTTEIAEGDQDGLLQDTLTFTASRGANGTTEEIYVGVS